MRVCDPTKTLLILISLIAFLAFLIGIGSAKALHPGDNPRRDECLVR